MNEIKEFKINIDRISQNPDYEECYIRCNANYANQLLNCFLKEHGIMTINQLLDEMYSFFRHDPFPEGDVYGWNDLQEDYIDFGSTPYGSYEKFITPENITLTLIAKLVM